MYLKALLHFLQAKKHRKQLLFLMYPFNLRLKKKINLSILNDVLLKNITIKVIFILKRKKKLTGLEIPP